MSAETPDPLEGLLERVAPNLRGRYRVEISGRGFEYHAVDGQLSLRGEDTVAVVAAFHRYCIDHVGQRFTWREPRLVLPDELPAAPATSAHTELEHRYYLNFVTSGYSSPFWDWGRWEREIDWMALHGINRPLMAIGHEAVLYETYLALGLDESAALEWLGSPAHLPWMFMGGLNSWGGPMSAAYLAQQLGLARRVLLRMRELGMSPVLPGFGGQVPLQVAGDETQIVEWQGWETPYVDPTTHRYRTVADVFYEKQRDLLGAAEFYAIDPFIESIPPREDHQWLEDAGRGIHAALAAHEPESTWILQAWPFHYHRHYWGEGRAAAFVSGIPEERLLLLDLWAEFAPLWEKTDAMFGRPWVWCAVHNYGGRFALFGDLTGTIEGLHEARNSDRKGQLVGLGLAMEAIENNEVFYELLLDQVWGYKEFGDWIRRWSRTRYGAAHEKGERIWQILTTTLYAPGRARSTPSPIIARPWNDRAPYATQRLAGEALPPTQVISANIDAENDPRVLGDLPLLLTACELLLEVDGGSSRDKDLQEVLTHVVAQHARHSIRAILRARDEDREHIADPADDLFEHIVWLDRLASTEADSMLGTWLADARGRATTHEEADRFEYDARSLITVWGRQTSGLHDYSGRHWAGLLRDFYLPRWRIWTTWLRSGEDDDALHREIVAHEEAWRSARNPYPSTPNESIDDVARQAIEWLRTHDSHPVTPTTTRNE